MDHTQQDAKSEADVTTARDLPKALARYRQPDHLRSVFELVITGIPYAVLWAAAWWALSIGYWLTLAISVPAAAFLMRLFLIKHDCGHGAFFRRTVFNDWVRHVLGVLTAAPAFAGRGWRNPHDESRRI